VHYIININEYHGGARMTSAGNPLISVNLTLKYERIFN